MPLPITPIRAFAERVCLRLEKLDYETVRDGELIVEGQLSCSINGHDTLASVSVVYECDEVIGRLRQMDDLTGQTERELGICQSICEDEVQANDGCDLQDELTESELFRNVFNVIQRITGIHESA